MNNTPKSDNKKSLDIFSLFEKTRTVDSLRNESVSQSQIDAILAAGSLSPVGDLSRPWLCRIVINDEEKRSVVESCKKSNAKWFYNTKKPSFGKEDENLIEAGTKLINEAPALIVLFGNTKIPKWRESVWMCVGFMMLGASEQGLAASLFTPEDSKILNSSLNIAAHYSPEAVISIGYPDYVPEDKADSKKPGISFEFADIQETDKSDTDDLFPVNETQIVSGERKCACGCGKKIVGLSNKRKYIHGHSKFGVNGLFKALKAPPKCKCGCGEITEWDWDRMSWKKFIDKHIGIKKTRRKSQAVSKRQIDIFK